MSKQPKCRMYITSNNTILSGEAADIYANATEREREILMIGYAAGSKAQFINTALEEIHKQTDSRNLFKVLGLIEE